MGAIKLQKNLLFSTTFKMESAFALTLGKTPSLSLYLECKQNKAPKYLWLWQLNKNFWGDLRTKTKISLTCRWCHLLFCCKHLALRKFDFLAIQSKY